MATVFVATGLLFFAVLWYYHERRDHRFYDQQRIRHVHHCAKCGNLYNSRGRVGDRACPVCGMENGPLRF